MTRRLSLQPIARNHAMLAHLALATLGFAQESPTQVPT